MDISWPRTPPGILRHADALSSCAALKCSTCLSRIPNRLPIGASSITMHIGWIDTPGEGESSSKNGQFYSISYI